MRTLLKLFIFFLLVYPAALVIVVVIDSVTGDQIFINQLSYESKRQLLKIILADWLAASLWVVPLMIFSYGLTAYMKKITGTLIIISVIAFITLSFVINQLPQMFGLIIAISLAGPLMIRWSDDQ
jgi:hypothetical protein